MKHIEKQMSSRNSLKLQKHFCSILLIQECLRSKHLQPSDRKEYVRSKYRKCSVASQ